MKPIDFQGANLVLAKDQPEYQPLPVRRRTGDVTVTLTSCWQLTWQERLRLLWRGQFYLSMLTFGHPPMPVLLHVDGPDWPAEEV